MTYYREAAFAAVFALVSSPAWALPVLLVNGSSSTSEPGTTSSITTQLSNLHMAVGNTVTVADATPVDLSPYAQVWDIRFSNSSPLTASDQTQYLAYLQAGNGMFIMGENSGFPTRNDSVLDFILLAGGGSLSFTSPSSTQDVLSPFTGPEPVASVTFAAPGGVASAGTGDFITQDSNGSGAGVAFGVGDLANAPLGALTVIFDVNFMQTTASPDEQALTSNLIGFVRDEVDPVQPGVVPVPAALPLLGLGIAALGLAARRRNA